MMFDYKGLEALNAVIECQSFELAAQKLYISQSAVSQRIKSLENQYEKPLLTRTPTPAATPLGKKLLAHYNRVKLLEYELFATDSKPTNFSLAINRDSLETWFLTLQPKIPLTKALLSIHAADQELTIKELKKGSVDAAISTHPESIQNGSAHYLGDMEYRLVATPTFIKRYPKTQLKNAPTIRYDQNDHLHTDFLDKHFKFTPSQMHTIPSVQGFKKLVLNHRAYALIPYIDIKKELQSGKLVEIKPNTKLCIPLYYHHWRVAPESHRKLHEYLIRNIPRYLSAF